MQNNIKNIFLYLIVITVTICSLYNRSFVTAEENNDVRSFSLENTEPIILPPDPDSEPVIEIKEQVNKKRDFGVDVVFGEYQKQVDENIYMSMSIIDSSVLVGIFGNVNTPMFIKAKETMNPCMAFGTTWGEAGCSYRGISMTTVMDFNPNHYENELDWISVCANLNQVDSAWYLTNCTSEYNVNTEGKAYGMPVNLLQQPRDGSRKTSHMTGLGVGAFQITSNDWKTYDLDVRVNPVEGYKASLAKIGTSWYKCGVNPISDVTVYAVMSLGHQGGALINYDFGKNLINILNRKDVQDSIDKVAKQMYEDVRDKAETREVSLLDINISKYYSQLKAETGINFNNYTGGPGSTNKGWYTTTHVLRYCFYKYYFGMK